MKCPKCKKELMKDINPNLESFFVCTNRKCIFCGISRDVDLMDKVKEKK